MPRKPTIDPRVAIDLRRDREAGVTLKEAAAARKMSVATACRLLAELRKRMGPEKFCDEKHGLIAGRRARAQLYQNTANSPNPTSNSAKSG